MKVKISPSVAHGEIKAPPSKSMAHRHLICAALAKGVSNVGNVAYSEDILATLDCVRAMGAEVYEDGDKVRIHGIGGRKLDETVEYRCRESGSTLRFFIGIALAVGQDSVFFGSDRLLSRPLSVYEDICADQGIEYEAGDRIHINGNIRPGDYFLPGNVSSQFISGLLFGLPLLDSDSRILFNTPVESASYIDLTIEAMSEFGVRIIKNADGSLVIPGRQDYVNHDVIVEGDYSNAAFLDVFNTIGGNVTVTGLREDSGQGDRVYRELYKRLRSGYDKIDISDCPDLGPVLMAVAAANKGASFTGTARLSIKESDRGRVMCSLLKQFGIDTEYEEDRIEVGHGIMHAPKAPIDGCNDHRIVMTAATLLSVTGGELTGAEAVRKSFPDYFARIADLGIEVTEDGLDQ